MIGLYKGSLAQAFAPGVLHVYKDVRKRSYKIFYFESFAAACRALVRR